MAQMAQMTAQMADSAAMERLEAAQVALAIGRTAVAATLADAALASLPAPLMKVDSDDSEEEVVDAANDPHGALRAELEQLMWRAAGVHSARGRGGDRWHRGGGHRGTAAGARGKGRPHAPNGLAGSAERRRAESTPAAAAAPVVELAALHWLGESIAQGEVAGPERAVRVRGVVLAPPKWQSSKNAPPRLAFLRLRPCDEAAGAGAGLECVGSLYPTRVAPLCAGRCCCARLQVAVDASHLEDSTSESAAAVWRTLRSLGAGDEVEVLGRPGRSNTGKMNGGLSLFATSITLRVIAKDLSGVLRASSALERKELEVEVAQWLLHDVPLATLRALAKPHLQAQRERDSAAHKKQLAATLAAAAPHKETELQEEQEEEEGELARARRERLEAALGRRKGDLVVVLENLSRPMNGGAIMRTCDAFGVSEVLFVFEVMLVLLLVLLPVALLVVLLVLLVLALSWLFLRACPRSTRPTPACRAPRRR